MLPCPLGAVFEPSGAVGAKQDREGRCGRCARLRALCCPGSIPSMWLEMQLGHGAVCTCCGRAALMECFAGR